MEAHRAATGKAQNPVIVSHCRSHATPLDWMLMALGTAGSIGNGEATCADMEGEGGLIVGEVWAG